MPCPGPTAGRALPGSVRGTRGRDRHGSPVGGRHAPPVPTARCTARPALRARPARPARSDGRLLGIRRRAPARPRARSSRPTPRSSTCPTVTPSWCASPASARRCASSASTRPRRRTPTSPSSASARKPREATEALLPRGTPVRLERDAEPRDQYGRLLAYVYRTDGTFVNLELAEQGLADVLVDRPQHRPRRRAAGGGRRGAGPLAAGCGARARVSVSRPERGPVASSSSWPASPSVSGTGATTAS